MAEQLPRIKEILLKYLEKLLGRAQNMKEAIPSVDSNLVALWLRPILIFLYKDAVMLDDKDINADKLVKTTSCDVWNAQIIACTF